MKYLAICALLTVIGFGVQAQGPKTVQVTPQELAQAAFTAGYEAGVKTKQDGCSLGDLRSGRFNP